MNRKKEVLILGFALFAMFFGAGNLIFPPSLGIDMGKDWLVAGIGFLLTGVGLPLLGVLAFTKIGRLEERYAGLKKHFSITITENKTREGYALDFNFSQVPVFDIDVNDEDPLLGTYVIETSIYSYYLVHVVDWVIIRIFVQYHVKDSWSGVRCYFLCMASIKITIAIANLIAKMVYKTICFKDILHVSE